MDARRVMSPRGCTQLPTCPAMTSGSGSPTVTPVAGTVNEVPIVNAGIPISTGTTTGGLSAPASGATSGVGSVTGTSVAGTVNEVPMLKVGTTTSTGTTVGGATTSRPPVSTSSGTGVVIGTTM